MTEIRRFSKLPDERKIVSFWVVYLLWELKIFLKTLFLENAYKVMILTLFEHMVTIVTDLKKRLLPAKRVHKFTLLLTLN